jgi:hypothetical protein
MRDRTPLADRYTGTRPRLNRRRDSGREFHPSASDGVEVGITQAFRRIGGINAFRTIYHLNILSFDTGYPMRKDIGASILFREKNH